VNRGKVEDTDPDQGRRNSPEQGRKVSPEKDSDSRPDQGSGLPLNQMSYNSHRTSSGAEGSRRSGRDRKDARPNLFKGHQYSESIRMRQICCPPVGFEETEHITIAFALPWEWKDEEIREASGKVLEWTEEVAKKVEQPTRGVTHVTVAKADLLKLSAEQRNTGTFVTSDEIEPRGIFILEPDWSILQSKKEQHWHVRFTGCSDEPNQVSKAEMLNGFRKQIDTAMEAEKRVIDRMTMKWAPCDTRGALSASRAWHLYLREQELAGNSMVMHNLIDPWILHNEGGTEYSSHSESGSQLRPLGNKAQSRMG